MDFLTTAFSTRSWSTFNQLFDYKELDKKFTDTLIKYLKCLKTSPTTTKQMETTIIEMYNDFTSKVTEHDEISDIAKTIGLKLSVEDTEKILTEYRHLHIPHNEGEDKGYIFLNMFVQMCLYPWNVSTRLSSCGVCYYGNMGVCPSNYSEIINLLKRNYACICNGKYR